MNKCHLEPCPGNHCILIDKKNYLNSLRLRYLNDTPTINTVTDRPLAGDKGILQFKIFRFEKAVFEHQTILYTIASPMCSNDLPYNSKFSWHNILVIFVINLSFTNTFFTKITKGLAFFTCVPACVASYLLTTKKQVLRKTNWRDNRPAGEGER